MIEKSYFPNVACPTYDEFADRYGGELLQERGDLQIVDGDLAMTRDFDLMLGDKPYDAMRRLLEEWRFKAPHVELLFLLAELMIQREKEAEERLLLAETVAFRSWHPRPGLGKSQEWRNAWQAHFGEEAAAQSGRDVYPGCIVLMASYGLSRFRDDIGCGSNDWKTRGLIFGGRSVGEILVASANGVRHQDEWFKTHLATPQQQKSIQVLKDALGEQPAHNTLAFSAGRCEEVIALLSHGQGFDGLSKTMFGFAHDIAMGCRTREAR